LVEFLSYPRTVGALPGFEGRLRFSGAMIGRREGEGVFRRTSFVRLEDSLLQLL
jgi:hypothetical protein